MDLRHPTSSMTSHNTFSNSAGSYNTSPTFTGLPPEIRLKIYAQIFSPTSNQPLRRTRNHHKPFPIAILSTNRTIHNEAIPSFYASHTFHYTLKPSTQRDEGCISQTHLPFLKHISLETSCQYNNSGDANLASALQPILDNCIALKTLTLHFLGSLEPSTQKGCTQWAPRSAALLRTLKPRLDRLTFVAAGLSKHMAWLRAEIESGADIWAQESLSSWPGLTLTVQQQLHLSGSGRRGALGGWQNGASNRFYVGGQGISAFHLCRGEVGVGGGRF